MLENILDTVIQQINIVNSTTIPPLPYPPTTNVTIPDLPVITLQNAFGSVTSTLIVFTIMLAVTFRQSSEAIAKWYNGEITTFKPKYIVQGIIAFISALPIGVGMIGYGATIFVATFGDLGLIGSLALVAVYAYGWTHGTNKASSLIGHFFNPSPKSNNTTTTGGPPNTNTTTKPVNPVS